jgi:hypothetical protein
MNRGHVADIALVITRRNTTETLEMTKEILHQMAPAILVKVALNHLYTIAPGWNHGLRPASSSRKRLKSKALSAISASKSNPSINPSTPRQSWRWPGNRTKRTKLPNASTKATILVLRPPRNDRWPGGPFFCSRAMLVDAHDGTLDKHILEVGVFGQDLEYLLEDALFGPSSEALEDEIPVSEGFG